MEVCNCGSCAKDGTKGQEPHLHCDVVDQLAIGGDEFIKLVKKKYRTMHDGQSLPKILKAKHDIFNGNVNDVGVFLFVYIMIGVLAVGLLIFSVYYAYFTPSTVSNTIEQSISFVSCDANDEEIVLISADKQRYVIRFINEQFTNKDIQGICDGETVVTLLGIGLACAGVALLNQK